MRTFETSIEVRSYELDSFGHLNHAVYLNYFEHARFRAFAQGGFPLTLLEQRGWAIHVVRAEVDYVKELKLSERVTIRTSVVEWKRSSTVIQQAAIKEDTDQVAARGVIHAVWIGPNRRPMRIPEEAREALA